MCVGDPLSLLTLSLSHALYLPRAVSPSHIPVWSVSKLEDSFSWTVQFVVERERRGRRRKKELCVAEKLLQTRIFVKTKDSSYHRRLFNRTCFQLQEKTTIVQFYLSNRQHTRRHFWKKEVCGLFFELWLKDTFEWMWPRWWMSICERLFIRDWLYFEVCGLRERERVRKCDWKREKEKRRLSI